MSRRVLFPSLILTGLALSGWAQPPLLSVSRQGEASVVSLAATDLTAQQVLGRLSGILGAPLKADAQSLPVLAREVVPVNVEGMLAKDLVEHLAGAVGLVGALIDGEIRITCPPAPPEQGGEEWLRGEAVQAFRRLATLRATDQVSGSSFELALLHFAGGELAEALASFQAFLKAQGADPQAPRARLLAGWCAYELGRTAEARELLASVEEHHRGVPEAMMAQLLLARCYLDGGPEGEVLVRLGRVIDQADDARLRALAILLRAEFHFRRGDGAEAVKAIRVFNLDMERQFPDLSTRLPLMKGLCLAQAGELEEAIPNLQLALLTEEDQESRARAAETLTEVYRDRNDLVTALLASEVALKLTPEGPRRLRLILARGRMYVELGVPAMARVCLEAVVQQGKGRDPLRVEAVQELGQLLFAEGSFEEAREIFSALTGEDALGLHARLMLVRCEMGLQRWAEALSMLPDLPVEGFGDLTEEVSRLRGQCYLQLGDYVRASLAFQGCKEIR